MQYYTAFGLNIESDLPLKPLREINAAESIDVSIRLGNVDKAGLTAPDNIKPFCQQAKNQHWFFVPDIAYFYITNGDSVVVDPIEGSDPQSVKLYILGTCMGIIFHQRDLLVIHGNAVRFGDKAVVFSGNSGNGKSTLAAAFHQKGYDILADDLAVIDKNGLCYPSYPQLKLWQDTAKKLNIDTKDLKRIRLQVNKYALPLTKGFYDKPLPVAGLYVLHNHNKDEFIFESIEGVEKLKPLRGQTYRIKQVEGLGLKSQHFQACIKLANNIKVTRITRPNKGFRLEELLASIEGDVNENIVVAANDE